MKKFTVIEVFRYFSPSVKESFDEKDDAYAFVRLLKRTHPNSEYVVCETIETL